MSQSFSADLPPIVTALNPSSEQRTAISQRRRDVVVTAGAGTGKTRTLVSRYLSLLAEDIPPRSIVAITFTTKAAREMHNRVRQEMGAYLQDASIAADERDRFQRMYRHLDAARIDTIHGLCSQILRAHPVEARLDPHFEVLDDARAAILRNRAVEATMAHAADLPETVPLFASLTAETLRNVLGRLIASRVDTEAAFAALPPDPRPFWQDAIRRAQEDVVERIRDCPQWAEAVHVVRTEYAADAGDLLELRRMTAWQAIQGMDGPAERRLACLSELAALKTGVGRAAAWSGGKPQVTEVNAALNTLKVLAQSSPILSLKWNQADDLLCQLIHPLHELFALMSNTYEQMKGQGTSLDFDDLESRALAMFESFPAVRTKWQGAVTAILVDEFQDTNQRQRDLVAHLNGGGGKLFIVGDAKQSIYGFRGADVSVFRAERDRLGAAGALTVSLDTSYRAHAPLIRCLNELLRPALGDEADAAHPWVEPFAPLKPHRDCPHPAIRPPFVEILLTVGSKSEGALDRASQALATRLIDLIEHQQDLREGKTPPLGYGDVAVLCRAARSFAPYEDAFEAAGIPYLTVAGRGFHDRPEVRDLLNALAALADPGDDLAFAGSLRSPAIGVSDAGLFLLRHANDMPDLPMSLWERLPLLTSHLDEGDRLAAVRALEILEPLRRRVGRVSVADLLKEFLDRTDYRAALLAAGDWRAARNVSKLLADAHAGGFVRVEEFLEFVAATRDVGTREGEAHAIASGAVSIMTVHAAKGLEFPIIVIGDVTHAVGSAVAQPIVDRSWGVILDPPSADDRRSAVFCAAGAFAASRGVAEERRLLYVAATRAREMLLLNGCAKLNKQGKVTATSSWLDALKLDLAQPDTPYNPDGDRCLVQDIPVGDTFLRFYLCEPGFVPAASPRSAPASTKEETCPAPHVSAPPPLLGSLVAKDSDSGTGTATESAPPGTERTVWRVVPAVKRPSAPRWLIGTLVHEALAQWRFPDEAFDAWVTARARGHGLTDVAQLANARASVRRMLGRFLAHEAYHLIDTSLERHHEVPYTLLVPETGEPEVGRIDCLFRRPDGWIVVDFKTDHVPGQADPRQWTEDMGHLTQLRRYVRAVERLRGVSPRAAICLLDFGGQVRLVYD